MFDMLFSMVASRVKEAAKFNIDDISPIKKVKDMRTPVMFLCGAQDTFVKPHHVDRLFDQYYGDKQRMLFEGDHNTPRSSSVLECCTKFIYRLVVEKNSSNGRIFLTRKSHLNTENNNLGSKHNDSRKGKDKD
mmetsp:Transcript_5144/g.10688  ORF Transcript_5144/g.10688 Transcript_5144/m.10688 type:complete len:133 (+) Transcript_5144:265-663(+)